MDLGCGISIADEALRITSSRSGGPGGQHVNTTSSKITLRLSVMDLRGLDAPSRERLRCLAGARCTGDDLVIQADEDRSQQVNRQAALERLRDLVARAVVRPRVRRATRPTRGSCERRLKAKRATSNRKSARRGGGACWE